MSDVIYGNWAATWSDTAHPGLNRQHQFRVPFQKIRIGVDVNAHTALSLDKTVQNTVVFGSAQTVTARIRAERNTQSLVDLVSAGLQGVALTLVDLDQTDRSVAVYIEDPAGTWVALHDMGGTPWEYEAEIRFRRTDGSRFPDWFLYQTHGTDGLLWRYVPGMDLSAATFTRATTATYTDINGTVQTDGAATNVARDAHYQTVSSTWTRTLRLESAESEALYFDWPHKPQASTYYCKFIDQGTAASSGAYVFAIGDGTSSRLFARWLTGPSWKVRHITAGGDVSSLAAVAASPGDTVEVAMQLFADGAVQSHASINGAATVSGTKSAANTLTSTWSADELHVNESGDGANDGDADFISVKVAAGVQSLDHMRAL